MFDKMSWRAKAGLAIALCLVLARFGLAPLYEWQDETIQKIKVRQKAVAHKKALIGNESRINTTLRKAESSFKQVEQFYYRDFSDTQSLQLRLQKEMERLSASCGVKIKSSDWLYPSEASLVQVPIKIRCEATPYQIIKFIHAIENGKHFFSVDRLQLTARGKSSVLFVELEVSAYGIKEQS
jgi:hypothetical protein